MKLSCVVLTKNEEKNIERCLRSLDFCDEIIIVDDYSEDKTIDEVYKVKKFIKLKSLKVYKRHLNGDFAAQRNFGLEKSRGEWRLFVDADEEVTDELRNEVKQLIHRNFQFPISNFQNGAYYIKRRDWFWGREVRFGEMPRWVGLTRLVRKNSGRWKGKVHEKFEVQSSKFEVKSLKNYINHYPHSTVKEFLEKINFYSSLRAEELFQLGKKTNIMEIILLPLGKFIFIYFFRLGLLDGAVGFVYAFMMSFHSFLVRAKLYRRMNANLNTNAS